LNIGGGGFWGFALGVYRFGRKFFNCHFSGQLVSADGCNELFDEILGNLLHKVKIELDSGFGFRRSVLF
jgi:hypothetical protein